MLFVSRYKSALWGPGEPNTQHLDEYEVCVALKSTGDLADWVDDDCYEPKGYVCKIEGQLVTNKRGIIYNVQRKIMMRIKICYSTRLDETSLFSANFGVMFAFSNIHARPIVR